MTAQHTDDFRCWICATEDEIDGWIESDPRVPLTWAAECMPRDHKAKCDLMLKWSDYSWLYQEELVVTHYAIDADTFQDTLDQTIDWRPREPWYPDDEFYPRDRPPTEEVLEDWLQQIGDRAPDFPCNYIGEDLIDPEPTEGAFCCEHLISARLVAIDVHTGAVHYGFIDATLDLMVPDHLLPPAPPGR